MISFVDGEISVKVPPGIALYEVRTIKPWPKAARKADWAWDEQDGHYVFELKDPESSFAQEDHAAVERILEALDDGSYYLGLARQLADTMNNHGPSRTTKAFYVLLCLDGDVQPDWGAVADQLSSVLRESGIDVEFALVNIELWNEFLNPRQAMRAGSP